MFGVSSNRKGKIMNNEEILLNLIREHENPEHALMMAMKMITYALEWQSSSNQSLPSDSLPLIDGIN